VSLQLIDKSSTETQESGGMDLNIRTEHDCLNRIVKAAHSFGSLTDERSDVIEGLDAILAVGVFQKYVIKQWERSFLNRPNPDECLDPDFELVEKIESLEQTAKEMVELSKGFLKESDSLFEGSTEHDLIISKFRVIQEDLVKLHQMLQDFRWLILMHDGPDAESKGKFVSSGEEFHATMMRD